MEVLEPFKMVKVVDRNYFKKFFEEEKIKPHVIKFYTDECGLCLSLQPDYERLSSELTDAYDFIKIDAFGDPALSNLLSASGVPTILLFTGGSFYEITYPDDGYNYDYLRESLVENKNLKRI